MSDLAALSDAALIEAFFRAEDAGDEELAHRLCEEIERRGLDI